MKYFIFLGLTLFLGLPVWAGDTPENTSLESQKAETKQQAKQDTPEEKAYKAKMIKMEDAIAQKMSEIQSKQEEIDTEVYPASTPPLMIEKTTLEKQLGELQMERDRIKMEESARKMKEDLNKNTSH